MPSAPSGMSQGACASTSFRTRRTRTSTISTKFIGTRQHWRRIGRRPTMPSGGRPRTRSTGHQKRRAVRPSFPRRPGTGNESKTAGRRVVAWGAIRKHHGLDTHTCDQILVVTSGSGMVATEQEKREINVGDVVHIKAGERHWHGAKADTTMGHITITLVGSQAAHG